MRRPLLLVCLQVLELNFGYPQLLARKKDGLCGESAFWDWSAFREEKCFHSNANAM